MERGTLVSDATNLQLAIALLNRGAITEELFEALRGTTAFSNPSEEP